MRPFTQQVKVCILILWALMLMPATADREYFTQTHRLTWNEARNHCQVCFKELVTLTPDNIQIITKKLTSDVWIGLRKNFYPISNSTNNSTGDYNGNYTSNSTGNSSMPWRRWSNGDLLTFQNWYPGQPVLKSSLTKPRSCSCSCTCPASMNARPTSFFTRHTEFTTQTSFTSVPDLNMTNMTSFTSVPDYNMTNMNSFTSVPDLNMTNMNSFTGVPDYNMTNITSFTSVPDYNMTNMNSFTSVPDYNMTNMNSFTGVADYNMTNITSFTSVPDYNMTNMTSFTSVPDYNMTNMTSFTSVPDYNMTNMTSFTSVPDYNMTNMTSFTSVPDYNMTNITSFTSVPDYNMTNITSFTSVPDYNMTNITSFTGVPDYNMTNITSFTSVPDYNMTNMTSFTSVPDYNMTNMTSFTSVPDYNMTNMTSFTSVPDYNMTNMTSFTSVTDQNDFTTMAPPLSVEGGCMCSSTLLHTDPEPDDNYMEDSCVAMLSFGAWVEKSCSEPLPFICYEDRFFGHVNVTNVTSAGASLSWLPAPNGVSHYRVEVTGDKQMTETPTNLTTDIFNLTAGTLYSVQVIPVKCERDLNPQEVSFYTIPNKVRNLTITSVTETSVVLMWNRPAGNLDFYLIVVDDDENNHRNNEEGTEVDGLMPGSLHTFTVLTGVGDNITLSEGSSISTYTKPGKVANLSVSENTNISLLLSWRPPEGHAAAYWVQAVDDRDVEWFDDVINHNSTQTRQQVKVPGLPMGTRIMLSVTALVNGTVKGDKVTVVNYTGNFLQMILQLTGRDVQSCYGPVSVYTVSQDVVFMETNTSPGPISNLSLQTTHNSLSATWTPAARNCSSFAVVLQLDGENVETIQGLTNRTRTFSSLKTAANYTVMVSCVSGHLHSSQVKRSKFTLPDPPTDAKAVSTNKSHITFQWTAPENAVRPLYAVRLNSSFWGHSQSVSEINRTTYTFGDLKSGSNYTFEVRTVTDEAQSPPSTTSHFTESEEMEIGLSMMCSSPEYLLCASAASEESVILQLQAHFSQSLGNAISWNLKKQERGNTGE